MNNYKVLLTTSGTGSRLGEITKYINKALVRIGKKPAISYIIESYPVDVIFVVTVGYLASQVKEFLSLAYPVRKFEFVQVDKYDGDGSSLGYSMLQAENNLQCPFIFHSCDTLVTENIPEPLENWIGGFVVDKNNTDLQLDQYRTHKLIGDKVISLKEKGDLDFESVHIGLVGVNSYNIFWKLLRENYEANPMNAGHSDVHVIDKMLKNGTKFKLIKFNNWYDTGNLIALKKTREILGKDFEILDKAEESIYIFDNFVIKFFQDKKMVKDRVDRGNILQGLTPRILESTDNFYKYEYVEGDLYSRVVVPIDFRNFLGWAKEKLWIKTNEVDGNKFKDICYDFYYTKTVERVKKFRATQEIEDKEDIINGESIPTVKEMLEKIDFDWLCSAEQTMFHGDFILDNILKIKDSYCLLDWRQNFGGLLRSGDMYYDLSKLNHNLTVNHDIINDNLFKIEIKDGVVNCDILRRQNLILCQEELLKFLSKEELDIKKVKVLTAIIWLNMSPLHHDPFNKFLFYFGKYNLWKAIQ